MKKSFKGLLFFSSIFNNMLIVVIEFYWYTKDEFISIESFMEAFMDTEVLEIYEKIKSKGSILGLDRIKNALNILGNPQDKINVIQITGTNGKGSTSNLLMNILNAHGKKVGYYSSPELLTLNERIVIDNQMIKDVDFERIFMEIYRLGVELTEFEMTTVMAYKFFYEMGVDFGIFEVGLGGENDATNISKSNIAAIITRISEDHKNILGSNVIEIAKEKSGIIKNGGIVVSAVQRKSVEAIIKEKSFLEKCPYFITGDTSEIDLNSEGSYFEYSGENYFVPLLGIHQVENSALAIEAAHRILEYVGQGYDTGLVNEGIRKSKWPGRMEVISKDPFIIIDGAHNLEASEVLMNSIKEIYDEKFVAMIGILGDKDYEGIIENMKGVVKIALAVEPKNPRALNKDKLKKIIEDKGIKTCGAMDTIGGIKFLIERYPKEKILVFGSLYMLGEIREYVKNNNIVT